MYHVPSHPTHRTEAAFDQDAESRHAFCVAFPLSPPGAVPASPRSGDPIYEYQPGIRHGTHTCLCYHTCLTIAISPPAVKRPSLSNLLSSRTTATGYLHFDRQGKPRLSPLTKLQRCTTAWRRSFSVPSRGKVACGLHFYKAVLAQQPRTSKTEHPQGKVVA